MATAEVGVGVVWGGGGRCDGGSAGWQQALGGRFPGGSKKNDGTPCAPNHGAPLPGVPGKPGKHVHMQERKILEPRPYALPPTPSPQQHSHAIFTPISPLYLGKEHHELLGPVIEVGRGNAAGSRLQGLPDTA